MSPRKAGTVSRLADIANALVSTSGPEERLLRALDLLGSVVPYQRCGFINTGFATVPRLLSRPRSIEEEGPHFTRKLEHLLALLLEEQPLTTCRPSTAVPHLAMPVVAADEPRGILMVERERDPFDERDVQVLAVVASQIGAYVATLLLREEEEKSRVFRERMIGIVSHDLRTPLGAIANGTELLLRRVAPTQQEQEVLARIVRSVRRAREVADLLLDLTRIELGGGLRLEREPCDLASVCADVIEEIEGASPGHQVRVSATGSVAGSWDRARLAQLISNLLANAVKHGKPDAVATLELVGGERDVTIRVHNFGDPIPAEILPRVFEPFKTGDPRAGTRSGGLGLGLYIAAQVARAHGGSIEVRSSSAEGTSFVVRLPRQGGADRYPLSAPDMPAT